MHGFLDRPSRRIAAPSRWLVVLAATAAIAVLSVLGFAAPGAAQVDSIGSARAFSTLEDVSRVAIGESGTIVVGGADGASVLQPDGAGGYDETILATTPPSTHDSVAQPVISYDVAINRNGWIVVGAAELGSYDGCGASGPLTYPRVLVFVPDGSGGYDETLLTNNERSHGFGYRVAINDAGTVIAATKFQNQDIYSCTPDPSRLYQFDLAADGSWSAPVEFSRDSPGFLDGGRWPLIKEIAINNDGLVAVSVDHACDGECPPQLSIFDGNQDLVATARTSVENATRLAISETGTVAIGRELYDRKASVWTLDNDTLVNVADINAQLIGFSGADEVILLQDRELVTWSADPAGDWAAGDRTPFDPFLNNDVEADLVRDADVNDAGAVVAVAVSPQVDTESLYVRGPGVAGNTVNGFECAADEGSLTWTNAGATKYWAYESTDGGASYNFLGGTAATSLIDTTVAPGTRYQVHYAGLPRVDCVVADPDAPITRLRSTRPAAGDEFGAVVAVNEAGIIVVGAPGDDDRGTDSGAAFVFTPNVGGGWDEQLLVAPDGAAGDRFGTAVAINDDGVVAVGAPNDGNGAAWAFTPVNSGGWTSKKLTPQTAALPNTFGQDVAIDDTGNILVGSPGASSNDETIALRLHVFTARADGTFSQIEHLHSVPRYDGVNYGQNENFGRGISVNPSGQIAVAAQALIFALTPDNAGGYTWRSDAILGEGTSLGRYVEVLEDARTAYTATGSGYDTKYSAVAPGDGGSRRVGFLEFFGPALAANEDFTVTSLRTDRKPDSIIAISVDEAGEYAEEIFRLPPPAGESGAVSSLSLNDAGMLVVGSSSWSDTGEVVVYDGLLAATSAPDPEPEPEGFACAADAGVLSWTDAGQSRYWIYRSLDNGETWTWLGRTLGDLEFTDQAAVVGARYQLHYPGTSRQLCTIEAEPTETVEPFACAVDGGVLSWTDAGQSRYWIYRSLDNGETWTWLGRTLGDLEFTDQAAVVGARYQLHYPGTSRQLCTIEAEPNLSPVITVQAEDYVRGVDTEPGNQGNATEFDDDVDVWKKPTNAGPGFAIGRIRPGESTSYRVSIPSAGSYRFAISTASGGDGGTVTVRVAGVKVGPTTALSPTGDWWAFTDTQIGSIDLVEQDYVVTVQWGTGQSNFDQLTITAD